MFKYTESYTDNNLSDEDLELLYSKIVTAADLSLKGYRYNECQDTFVNYESVGHLVPPDWFDHRQMAEEEEESMPRWDLGDNSDSGVLDYHVDTCNELLGLAADCYDALLPLRYSNRPATTRRANSRFDYANYLGGVYLDEPACRLVTTYPHLGMYEIIDLSAVWDSFLHNGCVVIPQLETFARLVPTNAQYFRHHADLVLTYIDAMREEVAHNLRVSPAVEVSPPALAPGQYTRKDWKPFTIFAGVQDGNCQLCAHTPEEHRYLESSIDTDASSTSNSSTDLNWQDVVINPVGAGWNYRDSRFKWFGKDLVTPVTPQRRSNVRNVVRTTVLTVVDDLRCHLRSLQVQGTLLGKSGAMTTRKVFLPVGQDRRIPVQCYPVHPLVMVAVVTPRRQRGRTMVTGVYNPRSDSIGIGQTRIAVERVALQFKPCRFHLRQWIDRGQASMAGQVMDTGLPVPYVLVDAQLYPRLWNLISHRVSQDKTTLVLLEGDTNC